MVQHGAALLFTPLLLVNAFEDITVFILCALCVLCGYF